MAINVKSTSDIKADGVKCVVYGGAGVGKTRLCATAPKPIIISAEEGLLSLADLDTPVDYVEIHTLKDLTKIYNELKNDTYYETICLDSLSEICEALIVEILPNYKDNRQAYGELAMKALPMLKNFRNLKGRNTVFTSKLISIQDEETMKVTEELFLPGKVLGTQVPYLVDELFCLRMDRKGKPLLQTKPDRTRFCKDRSGALDAEESIMDLTVLFNKIKLKSGN